MSRTHHARRRRTTDVLAPLARLVGRLWRQETRHFRRHRAERIASLALREGAADPEVVIIDACDVGLCGGHCGTASWPDSLDEWDDYSWHVRRRPLRVPFLEALK